MPLVRCPPGYHRDEQSGQCLDEQGNPYVPTASTSQTTTSREQVRRFEGKGEKLEFSSRKKLLETIPKEQRAQIDQNIKKIRRLMIDMKRDLKIATPILGPLLTMWVQYDQCVMKGAEIRQKAQSKKDKQMAEIYNQQLDEIYENIGDLDIDSVNQSKAKQDILEADRRLKLAMDEAKKEALKQGRGSEQYARYRAYADYRQMIESKRDAVNRRLQALQRVRELAQQREQFAKH